MGDCLGMLSAVDFFSLIIFSFFLSFWQLTRVTPYTIWGQVAKWSRGMIPALGAGGPGFKSQFGPQILGF